MQLQNRAVTTRPEGGKVHPRTSGGSAEPARLPGPGQHAPGFSARLGRQSERKAEARAARATARSPPGAPRLGLRAAPSRRMGPGAGSRHLPSPVSSSYPGHPTRSGSPRIRVRELERCGDAGLERKKQQQPLLPTRYQPGFAGILPPTWRPRPAARSACTCGPPALLRRGLYFHRDAVALHAEATSSASGPGTSAGSPGALGCKPGPAAAPSRRRSRGLPGRALQTPEPRGEPEAGPRGSASPGRCPRRLGTCRRT
ncbi:unnamed protein product [Nyctereutes procyonoides]|uniref:(raccoon dog) hypothetical protein n=1 Tax=Nyctereutes procyonoides TaxID=34880 RepID=A0A811ZM11_NYCPR|nr:unnamed protein product [Nyctereutes procyonoides]